MRYLALSIVVIMVLSIFSCNLLCGEELSPSEIVANADKVMCGDTAELLVKMTVIRPGESEKKKELMVYIKGTNEKAFVRYLFPPREKGTGYLMLGKDMWMYLPTAERSIRVGARQKMRGSDFSNSDVLRVSLSGDYEATLSGKEEVNGNMAYVLDLKAKDSNIAYDKVRYWVRVDDFMPIREEFFAISGRLLKTLQLDEIEEIGGRVRPTRMVMEDKVQNGHITILKLKEARFDIAIPEKIFTRLYLERGV